MSEVVHYKGKIKLVEKLPNETLEEQCKRVLAEYDYHELPSYFSSWEEMLNEELYNRYVVANENIYKVIEKLDKQYHHDIFNATNNKDGTYDYEVMYYNGNCGFSEAIENALNRC